MYWWEKPVQSLWHVPLVQLTVNKDNLRVSPVWSPGAHVGYVNAAHAMDIKTHCSALLVAPSYRRL